MTGASEGGRLHVRVKAGATEFEASGTESTVLGLYREFVEGLPPLTSMANNDGESSKLADEDDDVPLPVFIKTRDLDTNALRAAAIVIWASRYQSTQSLTPSEVMALWRQTPLKPPSNLPRDLGNAANQGWLRQEGGGSYSSTGYGEGEIDSRLVEE